MIQVGVHHGRITLSGEVDWYYQKAAAENDLHRLHGVRRIHNEVAIRQLDQITDIRARIGSALNRMSDVEAERILVSVTGRTVVLEGEVNSWTEREAAENAAWTTPGVSELDDRLLVID